MNDNESLDSSQNSLKKKQTNKKSDKNDQGSFEDKYNRLKKIKKVLTKAVDQEREKNTLLQKELDKIKQQNDHLERENKEKETKYLDLYMENS